MEFCVRLDQFEGPLDLMLHLITKNKLDLLDLDLDVLAGQYVAYIMEMKNMQLDIASEYMTEFAWLLEYKSRRMLPRVQEESADTDSYEEDQRALLSRRLLEYQKFKTAAELLSTKAEQRDLQLTRPHDAQVDLWQVPRTEGNAPGSAYRLVQAMKRVIHRQQLLHPYQTSVEVRELSVEERMEQLKARLPYMKAYSTLEDFCIDADSLRAVIVTFLAVLELIHQQILHFTCDEMDQIQIVIPAKEHYGTA